MTDEGAEPSDAADADERVVEFLRTARRPRHLASEVSEALDLPRGRVRTRLQALADQGRVVRTDAERTARWAVPDRADEPEPESEREHAADDGMEEDVGGGDGESGRDPTVEDTERTGDADGAGNRDRTEDRDGTDASATVEGSTGIPDPPTDDASPGSPNPASVEHGRRWRGPARGLALLVGLAVALVALGRLRRR